MTETLLPQETYTYGAPPQEIARFELDWAEFMHYLYLPVVMPGQHGIRLPERLRFLSPAVEKVLECEAAWPISDRESGLFVYLTARRGFATPGNALNRPGWHADGFGSHDRNYVWADRWPTRYAEGDFGEISSDHVESAKQFDSKIEFGPSDIKVYSGEPNVLYRLDPAVVHATPEIDGYGERSFFKISVSPNRYNLRGNSHNYLFDYEWKMWSRDEIRNDPSYAGGDTGPQT